VTEPTIRRREIIPNAVCRWASVHFSLVENGELISRAEVVQVDLEHLGQTYKIYGLCNVLTLPPFRGKGYGKQVVKAATRYILQSDVDLGLLFCEQQLESFYASNGWKIQNNAVTRIGTSADYKPYPNMRMVLLVSDKGKNACADFENHPMYIQYVW
jgi:GNAT superfamily N-acetyltransferase